MSIADTRYEPSEMEVLMSRAVYEAERRVKHLRKALIGIQSACDNRLNLSSEELIGEIAERAFEALQEKLGSEDDE